MGQQSISQEARRAALDAQSKRRRERAELEKRLEGLAVRVLVALRERDAAVADAERQAGLALRELTEDEGLSVREAVEWLGASSPLGRRRGYVASSRRMRRTGSRWMQEFDTFRG